MDVLLDFLVALAGFVPEVVVAAPLVAFVVDLLKRFGVAKDGTAGYWSLGLNVAAFAIMYFAGAFGVEATAGELFALLGQLAPVILALVLTLLGSKLTYKAGKYVGIAYEH